MPLHHRNREHAGIVARPCRDSTATSSSSPATKFRCIDAPPRALRRPHRRPAHRDGHPRRRRRAAVDACSAIFELTELYDVSFTERRLPMNAPHPQHRDRRGDPRRAREHRAEPALLHHRFRRARPHRRQPVREEWDELIAELRADPNRRHFVRNEEFDATSPNAAGARQGVPRLPDHLDHGGILRLRALCRDEEAREEQGHQRSVHAS